MEAISKTGSITSAARSMNMSRMTAWLLVEETNKLLSEPVVTTAPDARLGGDTTVTLVGEKTIALYHSIEAYSFITQSKRTLELRRAATFRPLRKLMRS